MAKKCFKTLKFWKTFSWVEWNYKIFS